MCRGRVMPPCRSLPFPPREAATDEQTTRDLARAVSALQAKQGSCAQRWRYYDGDQPLVYVNQRLQHVFRHIDARWSENWCSVVVDSLLDRIQLKGFKCAEAGAQAALDLWWDEQDVSADAEDVAKAVAVCSEGFYVVEMGEDGIVHSFENGPHLCAVLYSEADPKTPELAAKWWEAGKQTRLTLYYPDRLLHFVANAQRSDISGPNVFMPDPELPEEDNPYGVLPIFHYRRSKRGPSELTNVIPLQDALNKLFADMMVASEFGAYRQRYIISEVEMDRSKLNASPAEMWNIPASDGEGQPTQVGEFGASETQNFINALDHIASRIAVITRTPKHYLLQAGDVSGEALLAMEAPLVKKASAYRSRLEVVWKHVAVFVLALQGYALDADAIECVWEDEHTVQPYTEAAIRKTNVEAGLPLATQLRREGWSEKELAELQSDEDQAQARATSLADVAMAEARKRFDQGQTPSPYGTAA